MPLKIAIVGGGIAGITAAAALAHSGHEVEVGSSATSSMGNIQN